MKQEAQGHVVREGAVDRRRRLVEEGRWECARGLWEGMTGRGYSRGVAAGMVEWFYGVGSEGVVTVEDLERLRGGGRVVGKGDGEVGVVAAEPVIAAPLRSSGAPNSAEPVGGGSGEVLAGATKADLKWAYHALGRSGREVVSAEDAPSPGAWGWYLQAKENASICKQLYERMLKDEGGDAGGYEEDIGAARMAGVAAAMRQEFAGVRA